MHRFYLPQKNIHGEYALLQGPEAKHAFTVLRLRPGERIVFFDEHSNFYSGTIESTDTRSGRIKIAKKLPLPEKALKIILAAALPKGAQFDRIVDEATQLGVDEIIPLQTERTVVCIPSAKQPQKIKRWEKIAMSAAKQSQNPWIPRIRPVCGVKQALTYAEDAEQALIFSLDDDNIYLKDLLKKKRCSSVMVMVGPEGDFTAKEVALARSAGFKGVSLGDNVLRCRTAVGAILSILNYEWKY